MYKFKDIQTIPPAKQLIDIVLSRTQRKTPTVVHPGYKITRIRSFYMRKVKYCQSTFGEKFAKMLEEFPKIDDIHPFYADLCNVLYDRDHYKLALGQVGACKKVIDNIAKDYVRMMKFADSLYKCKMLKRAALGRMCTSVKKLQGSLSYLEEVRQHLGRLPSINPATRTLILTGYPNVGKSSFMNIVTNANVDVQEYAFTTKSLFVGHLDYNYVRWQVIDTPGILDHPLEDRNTIEMTAITALAHLPAAVLFFVDVSEMCGYKIETQVALYHSIKPLFRNRPLLIVLNKSDLRKVQDLDPEEKKLIEGMKSDDGQSVEFFTTSCATREGVDAVRSKACDQLLSMRVEQKVKQGKAENVRGRIHITTVTTPTNRPPYIPPSVQKEKGEGADATMGDQAEERKEKLEKERMEELGGAGVYSVDLWRRSILEDDSWKYDVIPEIMDGHNVVDFVDPDIDKRLEELEKEEGLLLEQYALGDDDQVLSKWRDTQGTLDELHSRMRQRRMVNRLNKTRNHPVTSRKKGSKKGSEVEKELTDLGLPGAKVRARSTSVRGRANSLLGKRKRDATAGSVASEGTAGAADRASRGRSASIMKGLPSMEVAQKVEKKRRKVIASRYKLGKKGEGDHWIPDLKPKHLYSGKRGIGKTDRR